MVFAAAAALGRRTRCCVVVTALRPDLDRSPIEPDLDGAIEVGPIRRHAPRPQPIERLGGGMAIVVLGTDRDDRHARARRVEECGGCRGPRAMVGDLQQVDVREPSTDERRVDVLLGIAGEEEPLAAGHAEQDDGRVVDRLAVVERPVGNRAGIGPDHGQMDGVEGEPFAGDEMAERRPTLRERGHPGAIAGTGAG
jgi:hypothetical protein